MIAPQPRPIPDGNRNPVQRRWRGRVIAALIVGGLTVSLLPILAILRGAVSLLSTFPAYRGGQWLGLFLAFLALSLGTIFFAYSIWYYLATIVAMLGLSGRHVPEPAAVPLMPQGTEPFVSVHIATYNEKRVIGRLLEACAQFDYPNYEVIIADDSTDETTLILDAWKDHHRFKILHRATRAGFKGGALQEALRITDPRARFVVVFDADSIPFPNSIQRLLRHFYEGTGGGHRGGVRRNEQIGAVQGYQWHVLNKSESWLTQAVRTEYAGSYMVERPFQQAIGSMKMIAGTAYMIRADILRELGWGRSLTEDWELTLRLYALGFKVIFTPYAETPAECVSTFTRLARQRMRWAEGHTYNVRKWFWSVLRSPRIGVAEKVGFGFFATYYLQALFFAIGSIGWLLSEVVLKVHVPEWTALMGWSLLFSNLLALPMMNVGGLIMEAAPARDFSGVLGALAISYLLAPFQAWAALKGLIERDEGPWFRTPKTGRITDPVWTLRGLLQLRRRLWGGNGGRGRATGPARIVPNVPPKRRPAPRLGWVMIGVLTLTLIAIGVGALRAPTADAAGTTNFYLHHSSSGGSIAFVQAQSKTEAAAGTSIAVTISSTSGHLLVLMVAIHSTVAFVSSVTDTAGNTWTKVAGLNCGSGSLTQSEMWYARNAAAVTSVTANLNMSKVAAAYVLEFSGADPNAPLDVANSGCSSSASSTTPSSGAVTPGATTDVIVGLIKVPGSVTYSAGPTFTSGTTNNQSKIESNDGAGNIEDLITGYDLPASAASQTYSGTFSAGHAWSSIVAAFQSASEYLDGTSPSGLVAHTFDMTAVNNTQNWATTTPTAASQTIFTTAVFKFNYSSIGIGTSTATLTFGYDSSGSCQSPTTLASQSVTLTVGVNLNTANFSPGSNVVVPTGSFFCWTMTVTAVATGGLTLNYDASTATTNVNTTQTIYIPELALLLAGFALFIPRLRRRSQ